MTEPKNGSAAQEGWLPTPATAVGGPIRRLAASVLLGYLGFGATLQLLPAWIAQRLHGGPLVVGLAVGIAFGAAAICRPLAGRAGDAGHARGVVVAAGVLITVGALGQWLAPTLGVVLAARLIMGAGEAALFNGALPWVLAGIPAENRGRVAGWFGLSMWAGLALGPLATVAATHVFGLATAWMAVAALDVFSALIASTTRRQTIDQTTSVSRTPTWRQVLPRGAGLPGLIFGAAAYGYGTISALLVLFLDQSLGAGSSIGLTVFAAAFLFARVAGSPVADRLRRKVLTIVNLCVEAGGLTVVATAHTLAAAMIGTAITGAGVGLMFPAIVVLTLCRVGGERAGAAVGAASSLWDIGIMIAGPLGGALVHLGYPAAFAAAALIVCAAAVVAAALSETPRTRASSTSPP
ncbi:MFS transporter [Mycobacterium interjectum]|uniref:MFS transporter n=1 Tax=Mycobacterium interjectum TaxID=33895 RepID=UPI00135B207E|nr:MFS transporter [Mycobacterium interjectum]